VFLEDTLTSMFNTAFGFNTEGGLGKRLSMANTPPHRVFDHPLGLLGLYGARAGAGAKQDRMHYQHNKPGRGHYINESILYAKGGGQVKI